ncbi:MAG: sulfatase-like hydrolase/transferase [Planctomycetes bacterium]|nr:sulfatase-like hydrolase/transferase [Planctomycetota bacterium]
MITTRNVLTITALVVWGALAARLCFGQGSAAPKDRPNVLFLLSDDQQWNAIGALGNTHIKTPNLDRLVARGITFSRTYCMGSWSGAVCLPSRAMLMTGRTLWRVNGKLDGLVTWPETLKNHGYATFFAGKWHNGTESFARSFTHGGHIMFGGMSNHLRVPVFRFDADGKYPKENKFTADKFSSELFADDAIAFLETYDADRPFFAYVAFTAPHDPRMAPAPYAAMYDPDTIPLPANFMPEHPFDNGELRIRDEMLAPFPRTPKVVRQHIAAYYAMITHMDAQIGRILDALKKSGHDDDTIIVFASDHGLALGQHGLMGKQNMYEHSLRAPLIIAGPGIPAGKRTGALCYLLDIFPTVLDLLNIPIPKSVAGRSLKPVIAGEQDTLRRTIYCAYKGLQRMVRDERFKLIKYHVKNVTTIQLFDLKNDPQEMHDLSKDPAHRKTLESLEAKLADWRKRSGDKTSF